MGKIVQLFKKMSYKEAKNEIISNLKDMHHSKLVNQHCAVHGIDDLVLANDVLHDLIAENFIITKKCPITNKFGQESYVTMYRYNAFC